MHTSGRVSIFEAFCGFETGTPPKAINEQKFVTRPALTARTESLRCRRGRGALLLHCFLLAGLHRNRLPRRSGRW
jgi:hypothetical protein